MYMWVLVSQNLLHDTENTCTLQPATKHIHIYIYTHRIQSKFKMTFVPLPRKANFTESKGYHPICLYCPSCRKDVNIGNQKH
jgi:hypothetical protein